MPGNKIGLRQLTQLIYASENTMDINHGHIQFALSVVIFVQNPQLLKKTSISRHSYIQSSSRVFDVHSILPVFTFRFPYASCLTRSYMYYENLHLQTYLFSPGSDPPAVLTLLNINPIRHWPYVVCSLFLPVTCQINASSVIKQYAFAQKPLGTSVSCAVNVCIAVTRVHRLKKKHTT